MFTIKAQEMISTGVEVHSQCLSWLQEAAKLAQRLMNNEYFPVTFHYVVHINTEGLQHRHAVREDVIQHFPNRLLDLQGIEINIDNTGDEYISYTRSPPGEPVSKKITANKRVLDKMLEAYNERKSFKRDMAANWVAFLAVKIFRTTNRILLALLDSPDLPLKEKTTTHPDEPVLLSFCDCIEINYFGGILHLSNWPSGSCSGPLVFTKDGNMSSLIVVVSVQSILRGELEFYIEGHAVHTQEAEGVITRAGATQRAIDTFVPSYRMINGVSVASLPPEL